VAPRLAAAATARARSRTALWRIGGDGRAVGCVGGSDINIHIGGSDIGIYISIIVIVVVVIVFIIGGCGLSVRSRIEGV
jgi:hypothetical protein